MKLPRQFEGLAFTERRYHGPKSIMNRTTIFLISASIFCGGCSRAIKGNGVIVTENRPIQQFSEIDAGGAFEIQWSDGQPVLTVVADENLLLHINTAVTGHTLRIDSDLPLAPTRQIKVTASSDALTDARLAGAIHLSLNQVNEQKLKVAGAGAVSVSADGSATELSVDLTGASKLSASSLKTQSAIIALTGASRADISVADTLKASITGAGSLTYSGNPKSVDKNVTGAGSIQHRP
jgi:hypothetical protein